MASLFRNFAVLRLMHSFPFAPIQIVTSDTRQGCSSRRGRLHDEGRSLQQKPRIERRFESQVAGRSRLLETWSPCSRPFAILPVSAVSHAQKLATGNFLHVRAAFFLLFVKHKKQGKKNFPFGKFFHLHPLHRQFRHNIVVHKSPQEQPTQSVSVCAEGFHEP